MNVFSSVVITLLFAVIAAFPESDFGKVKLVNLSKEKKFAINFPFVPAHNQRIDIKTFDEDILVFKDLNYEYFHVGTDGPEIPAGGEGMKIFHFTLKNEQYTECPMATKIEFVRYYQQGKNERKNKITVEFLCENPVNEL